MHLPWQRLMALVLIRQRLTPLQQRLTAVLLLCRQRLMAVLRLWQRLVVLVLIQQRLMAVVQLLLWPKLMAVVLLQQPRIQVYSP